MHLNVCGVLVRDEASTGSKSVGVTGGKVACSRSNKTVGVATTEATCSQSTKRVGARGVATAKTTHGTSLLCHSRTCRWGAYYLPVYLARLGKFKLLKGS